MLGGRSAESITEETQLMVRTNKKSPTRKQGTTVRAKPTPRPSRRVVVLVATRKGAWLFHGDAKRSTWRVDGPHFLGQIINHLVLDPRDGRTLLAAAKTGHLGPTVFRSTDFGRTWKEAARPPAFAKALEGPDTKLPGRVVNHSFWLTPCHAKLAMLTKDSAARLCRAYDCRG